MALSSPEVMPIYLPFAQSLGSQLNVVCIDHCYAKPWSTHPEASSAQTVRYLFMEPLPRQSSFDKARDESDMIDVEGQDKPVMPGYDITSARVMMSECKRHASFLLRPDSTDTKDDWEDHIASIRTTWTVLQNRLFAKVMRVLQGDCLARLTIEDTKNEPIQRRLQIDKAAKRVKFAFANVNWEMTLILWLHNLFLENLRGQLLTSYLEILQTLKLKIPSLVESLMEGTVCKPGGLTMDSLNVLLKKTWDPVLLSINQHKPKKLPGQALLLVISNVPATPNTPSATKRHKFWQHQLNFLGKVFNIVPVNNNTAITVAYCVENVVASTRSKILEVKGHFPGRPIVLVGFHIGSLVACQVALVEQVHAVVCLGFPTMGVNGNRGEVDDPVYNCKTPTLFVVGQHASSCSLDKLEDVREKIRVDTGLIVVGGADDHLRMCRAKKKNCGVTQSVVDRCVIDEISNFLGNSLQSEVSSSDSMDDVDIVKKTQRKRKQKQAVAVGSQTPGDLVKQKSAKALKCLKKDPMLSSVGATMGGNLLTGGPSAQIQSVPKLTKSGKCKRASPKKQAKCSDSEPAGKRPLMQGNVKANSKKAQGQSSLSTRNEAAVIASAPELSNLLQNMKTDITRFSTAESSSPLPLSASSTTPVSSLPPPSFPSPSVQTTTALTLSKFLLSSNVFKSGDSHLKNPETSISSKLDCSDSKNSVTSTQSTSLSEHFPKKQETQILIHTRDSTVPISFPVTLTMASKVLKTSTPLMKVAGVTQSIPNVTFDSKLKQSPTQAGPNISSPILSPKLQSVVSSSSSNVMTSTLLKGCTPATKSPLASVINMGNDTVQMKETPPSTTTPGTVSIDLGQLSTSNNIVMKFGNPSKISLMPTLKPVLSSSLPRSDKSDVTLSGPLEPTKSIVSSISMTTITPASKLQSAALPVYTTGKSSEKNLTILSSSDLLSSLSSNTGLITLKLANPSHSKGITFTTQKPPHKTIGNEGITFTSQKPTHKTIGNEGITFTSQKPPHKTIGNEGITFMSQKPTHKMTGNEGITFTSQKPTHKMTGNEGILKIFPEKAAASQPKNSFPLTVNPSTSMFCAKMTKPTFSKSSQKDHQSQTTAEAKVVPSSMSVIFAPSTKIATAAPSPGRFVYQTNSSTTGSTTKTVLAGSSETLGKVTSLLESNPVTVVDHPKLMSVSSELGSNKDFRADVSTKDTGKHVILTPPPPSCQGQAASATPKVSKSSVLSYTPTTKNVLPTVASTRTRRIKTPKQYDL